MPDVNTYFTSVNFFLILSSPIVQWVTYRLLFLIFSNPSKDYTIIKSKKLYDIKGRSVNSEKFLEEIKKLNPDMIIVGSWGEKFKKDILNAITCVNFHPALLPKNRGANPYFWSIYLNQTITGLTIHYMNEKYDRGDILLQEAITIDDYETGMSLKEKTTRLARGLVKDFLNLYDKNQLQPIKQNEEFASYEPQLSEQNVIVDLSKSKKDVDRHLRALYPWAVPYVKIGRRYVKIPNSQFFEVSEKYKEIKPHSVIENNKEYFVLKGSDFLIKVLKK